MKKPLRKLIAFSTAMAAMLSGTVLNAAAVYVSEQVEDCDYDTLIQMRDKEILIKDGDSENISDDTQLVVIDENGEKQLIDKSLGINGIYSYVSTTMGRYNYISPTGNGYSFDFFDESYRISTEANEFIVGIEDKFAVMNNEQEIISEKYNNIYRINEDYFIIDDSVNPEYHGEYWDDGLDKYDENKSGLMKADGTVIVPTTDGIMGFYLTADGKNFLVKSENGDYFMDLEGNAVTGTYSDITELRHTGSGDSDDDHFNIDKYRANYLLCDYGFKAEDENGKYTVLDKSCEIVEENVKDCYSSYVDNDNYGYTIENDEYIAVYDEDFNLISKRESFDNMMTIGDSFFGDYKTVGYVTEKDGAVKLWDKTFSESTELKLDIPDEAEIDNIFFDSYRGASQCNLIIDINYHVGDDYNRTSQYYMIAESGDLTYISDSDYYGLVANFHGNMVAIQKTEDSPVQIINYSGEVIYTFPDDFQHYDLTQGDAFRTIYSWNDEKQENELWGYVINSHSTSTFSVLDLEFNPIWENIPGGYNGYNYCIDSGEERKYGIFNMEKGVVIKPEYDSVKQISDGYFALKDEILYAFDADGNLKNQWNDTYEYDTTTHSSYKTLASLGDKYFAVIDGNSAVIDSDMNLIQEWDGIYNFESGTYSAFTVDHTFNKRENGVTSTIVYNSETNAIDYQQEGIYDHVSICLAGYMVVTNYDDSDSLWSGNNSKGIIKLDGTEIISPINNLDISMSIDYDLVKETKIVNEDEIGFALHGEGMTNSDNYYWWCYLKPAEIQY